MGKMHELLAVETSIVANYNRDVQESLHVLGKASNFMKESATKTYFDEAEKHLDTTTQTELVTTVPARMNWHKDFLAKFIDVKASKDLTNQTAKADIVLEDGTVLAKNIPATTLLMLETRLGVEYRKMLLAMPTLDAGLKWDFDVKETLWRRGPEMTTHTRKITKPVVLYPATDKHPANVKEVNEDVVVAKTERTIFSGMITSTQKANALTRLDTLVNAIRQARQRANNIDAVNIQLGGALMNYVLTGLELKP